jgi:hypothetical protein
MEREKNVEGERESEREKKRRPKEGSQALLLNGEPAYPGGGCCIVTVPARDAHEDEQHHPGCQSNIRQAARLLTRRGNPASRRAEAGLGNMVMMTMMRSPVIRLPHVYQCKYNIWRNCCAGGADCGPLRVALHSPRVASEGELWMRRQTWLADMTAFCVLLPFRLMWAREMGNAERPKLVPTTTVELATYLCHHGNHGHDVLSTTAWPWSLDYGLERSMTNHFVRIKV